MVFVVASGLAHEGQAYGLGRHHDAHHVPVHHFHLADVAGVQRAEYVQALFVARLRAGLLNVAFIVAALFVAPHLQTPVYALGLAVIAGGVLQFSCNCRV